MMLGAVFRFTFIMIEMFLAFHHMCSLGVHRWAASTRWTAQLTFITYATHYFGNGSPYLNFCTEHVQIS